ncbi:MAG: prepilin-type N-terminal cleavage/methylation domain-containing protein [Candidatus Omnitrophica bacterium]|nr:prepilin-type N-terminal cleavage/methylation domain-containing protein [Candidatus Omnitrophota bacterium]
MQKDNAGFTLVELLIASTILVIVLVVIYSGFRTGVFGSRDIAHTVDLHQAAMEALERINIDLRNSFIYTKKNTKFFGDKEHMSFLSLTDKFSEDGNSPEYCFISYELDNGKLIRAVRKNKASLDETADAERDELADGVEDLTFSYGISSSDAKEILWKESLEGSSAVPFLIQVRLALRNGKAQSVFERNVALPLSGISL